MALFTINTAQFIYHISAEPLDFNFTYNSKVVLPDGMPVIPNISNSFFRNYLNDTTNNRVDCNLQIKITSVPTHGQLYCGDNLVVVNQIIDYCTLVLLTFFPNGSNNELGNIGNYNDSFSYKFYDQNGRSSSNYTSNLHVIDVQSDVTVTGDNVSLAFNYNSSLQASDNMEVLIQQQLVSNYYNSADQVGGTNPFHHIEITSLPNKGTLYSQQLNRAVQIGDTFDFKTGNDLQFFIDGYNGNQNIGTYSTTFTYKLVDNYNNKSNIITANITAVDNYCSTISDADITTKNIITDNPISLSYTNNGTSVTFTATAQNSVMSTLTITLSNNVVLAILNGNTTGIATDENSVDGSGISIVSVVIQGTSNTSDKVYNYTIA